MRSSLLKTLWFVFALVCFVSCNTADEITPDELTENQFLIRPAKPVSTDEVKLISYDCIYNQLFSVKKNGVNIEVIKHFNSMMKWPCVLKLDTISLGMQEAGTYRIKLLIVDTSTVINPADSVSYSEEKIIVIAK